MAATVDDGQQRLGHAQRADVQRGLLQRGADRGRGGEHVHRRAGEHRHRAGRGQHLGRGLQEHRLHSPGHRGGRGQHGGPAPRRPVQAQQRQAGDDPRTPPRRSALPRPAERLAAAGSAAARNAAAPPRRSAPRPRRPADVLVDPRPAQHRQKISSSSAAARRPTAAVVQRPGLQMYEPTAGGGAEQPHRLPDQVSAPADARHPGRRGDARQVLGRKVDRVGQRGAQGERGGEVIAGPRAAVLGRAARPAPAQPARRT